MIRCWRADAGPRVRTTLSGYGDTGGGQTDLPSTSTS